MYYNTINYYYYLFIHKIIKCILDITRFGDISKSTCITGRTIWFIIPWTALGDLITG